MDKPKPGKVKTPYDALTYKVIGLAMDVHRELGAGFHEEFYHRAMRIALMEANIVYDNEYPIEVVFRGQIQGRLGYRTHGYSGVEGGSGVRAHARATNHRLPSRVGLASWVAY